MTLYVGIDWSMTSPCICLTREIGNPAFNTTQFMVQSGIQKYGGKWNKNILVKPLPLHTYNSARFEKLATTAINFVKDSLQDGETIAMIALEDFAFAAKGKVFDIGENAGVLKYLFWKEFGVKMTLVAPTAVKKIYSGKGNADKDEMYKAFVEREGVDLVKIFDYTSKEIKSPLADMVDAFGVLLCGLEAINKL